MSEEGAHCTQFIVWDDYDCWTPCRCPACGGFLPRDFPIGNQFQCRKCGQVLETMPNSDPDLEDDEQDDDMEHSGRICAVPDYAIKIEVIDFKELRKQRKGKRKKKTNKWALGIGFSRKVWIKDGIEFIEIEGETIPLDDPRINRIVEFIK